MRDGLDDRDRQILDLLRADAWLTYAALAERVSLSPSAVQRRVEKLIARGVLIGARATVSASVAGRPLKLFVLIELRDDAEATIRRFVADVASDPMVTEAAYVTGEADVVLQLELADMEAYESFVRERLNASASVRRFKTLARLRILR
jgi:DNA-binding Lrp family transcriptional regulator